MAGVAINVLDPEFYVDPWQAYRWLRDEAPAWRDPVQQVWAVSRYDDVRAVERDTGRYSSADGSRPLVDQREDQSMINMDDPRHQDQRKLVSRRFTPRATRRHEAHVREIATGILDAVTPLGQCEAVEAIASRLPAMMIGDLPGYPHELWERVRHWSEQTMVLSGQTSPDGPPHVMGPGLPAVWPRPRSRSSSAGSPPSRTCAARPRLTMSGTASASGRAMRSSCSTARPTVIRARSVIRMCST